MPMRLITWCIARGSWNTTFNIHMHCYVIMFDDDMNYIYVVGVLVDETRTLCTIVLVYASCSCFNNSKSVSLSYVCSLIVRGTLM